MLICSVHCISALLRCPASASPLVRALRLADRCAKNCFLNIKLQRFSFGQRDQRPLAVPSVCFGPWAGLASC
ncbi:hypothetical protein FAEPRAA2165_02439 [Faecalibacterium duncaniae]|uniref:Secreted protein n=1 Tax=Faecalibacterium duncaniae (strain DSM 17677 / JCM 31915 / A2-165) TaxID=411483 RepID=C7H804_FAED2|nr:hypothetical protein FAEPRAA2165_02439 [Faecalibacterium duncaniae]